MCTCVGEPGCALKKGSGLCVSESQKIGLGEGDSGAVARQVGPGTDWGSLEKVQEEEPEAGERKEHRKQEMQCSSL